MSRYETVFFQAVEIDGTELDIARLVEGTYIESIDLSGPKVIVRFNDADSTLRDDSGVSEGSTMVITVGTPDGNERMDSWEFTVVSFNLESDLLTINGLFAAVYALKLPPAEPKFFVDQKVPDIIADLSGLKPKADRVAQQQTYHLTPQVTPGQLIRGMARENALQVFVSRGELNVRERSGLMKGRPAFQYEYLAPGAEYQVRGFRLVRHKERYRRRMERNHIGWSMTEGLIDSGSEGAPVLSSLVNKDQLENLPGYMLPLLEFDTLGNDSLTAGMKLKFVMNRFSSEAVIDESIPEEMIITRVSHQQRGMKYVCFVEVGLPHDEL